MEYDATHAPTPDEDRFVILTNADDAVNFKLVTAPVDEPGREHWEELVAHRPDVKLEGVSAFAGHLVRYERREGVRRIVVTPYGDGAEHELAMPEEVYDTGPATNAEFTTSTLRFTYTSLVTPGTVFDEDLDTGERTLLKTTEVVGGHDPADYVTGRLWATAPDGTRVPISYVHRADVARDGTRAVPPLRLRLLRGVHRPRLLHPCGCRCSTVASCSPSPTCAAAARWAGPGTTTASSSTSATRSPTSSPAPSTSSPSGFTAPDRLVARGASAGGLLMGAITNLRPDLFAAVVAEVPFVDCLTTILDETLPLTVTEWEEWGNPVDDEAVYDYMAGYSPYDNVTEQAYPTILATSGLNDPRVSYWEPAKWVYKLRGVHHERPDRSTSRPRWAPATRARAAATTRGRTRRSCSPSSSTPSAGADAQSWSAVAPAGSSTHASRASSRPGRVGANTTSRSPASTAVAPVATTTSSPRRTTATRASCGGGTSRSTRPTMRADEPTSISRASAPGASSGRASPTVASDGGSTLMPEPASRGAPG